MYGTRLKVRRQFGGVCSLLPPHGPRDGTPAGSLAASTFAQGAIISSAVWDSCLKPLFFFWKGEICHLQLALFLRTHNAQTGWLWSYCLGWKVKMDDTPSRIMLSPTNPEVSLLVHFLRIQGWLSSSQLPPVYNGSPWHHPPWILTGFLDCSEWAFQSYSSIVWD